MCVLGFSYLQAVAKPNVKSELHTLGEKEKEKENKALSHTLTHTLSQNCRHPFPNGSLHISHPYANGRYSYASIIIMNNDDDGVSWSLLNQMSLSSSKKTCFSLWACECVTVYPLRLPPMNDA